MTGAERHGRIVTALRPARGSGASRRGRRLPGEHVAVELDGAPWRVLPLEAVLAVALDVGVAVDRERARRLARELRRLHARAVALSALRHRDHSSETLRRRLEERGVRDAERDATVEAMQRSGIVDDRRFAYARAAALASRGAGDLRIRADLEGRGLPAALVAGAIEALEPEGARARQLVAARGASPRALRRLAANGFSADSIEQFIADQADAELRYGGFV